MGSTRARGRHVGAVVGLLCAACSGGGGPPGPRSITLEPAEVQLEPGATVQFHARTTGDVGTLSWSVNGEWVPGGGPSRITAAGLYQAPDVSPLDPVTIACTSDDGEVRATAQVTFPALAVTVSPSGASITLGQSRRFTATVRGAVDQTVSWSATGGTVDPDGTFHATASPFEAVATVTAYWGSGNRSVWGSAILELLAPAPVLAGTAGPAAAGEAVTVSGEGVGSWSNSRVTVLFPSAAGPLRVPAAAVTDTTVTAPVPPGATSGPLSVELRVGPLAPVRSNEIPFTRLPRLRLHPDENDVAAGGSTALRVAWLGAPGPFPLTWTASAGAVVGGRYVAPATVTSPWAHVTACISGTTSCDGTVIGLRPLTATPAPALVAAGQALTLGAQASGPVPATWELLAGGGAVSREGTYQASARLEDAGSTWLLASTAADRSAVQVGVTGRTPGLVGRAVEHVDFRGGFHEGAYAEAVTADATRAYVAAGDPEVLWGARHYFWIDVYDVTDAAHPAWLGAVESPTRPTRLLLAAGRLYAYAARSTFDDPDRTLAVYDLSSGMPELLEVERWPDTRSFPRFAFDGRRIVLFDDPPADAASVPLHVYDTAAGPFVEARSSALALPAEADPTQIWAATAADDRAYLAYRTLGGDHHLAVYDLAADPPALLRTADGGGFALAVAGPFLFVDHAVSSWALDRTGDSLALRGGFPFGASLVATGPGRAVLAGAQSSLYVIDTSDASAARVTSTLFSGLPVATSGALAGDRLFLAEGLGGLAGYDVGPEGGPALLRSLPLPRDTSPYAGPSVSDLALRGPHLYAVGARYVEGGWLGTYDTSVSPPALTSVHYLPHVGSALAQVGSTLAVGTAGELVLYDLTDPAHPAPTLGLEVPTAGLGVSGSLLCIGTEAGAVQVLDLGGPGTPALRGSVAVGGAPYAFAAVEPGLVAVAVSSGNGGALVLLDLALPDAPRVAGQVALGARAFDVAVQGSAAFVATAAGLAVVDVSRPAAPEVLQSLALPGHYPFGDTYQPAAGFGLALDGGILWVGTAAADGILLGYDVRRPAWPRLVTESAVGTQLQTWLTALAFDGQGRAYLAGDPIGVLQLDVRQPRNVVLEWGAAPDLLY